MTPGSFKKRRRTVSVLMRTRSATSATVKHRSRESSDSSISVRAHSYDPIAAFTDSHSRQIGLLTPGLEPHQVYLVELQLGRVLDEHDAIIRRQERRERVQQRRLPGTGPAADQDVLVLLDCEAAPR